MDEAVWIEGARRGKLDDFNRLVIEYQSRAFNLAYRIVGDGDSAADAVQEAFLSAYRNLSSFRGGSFRAWLYRIVTNASYDELRRRKRRPAVSLDELEDASPAGDGAAEASPLFDPIEGPEQAAARGEMARLIERCLEGLPAEFRAVVVLADVMELDYREVAASMGCPVGTVRSRLARARARLRECLEAHSELFPRPERLARGET